MIHTEDRFEDQFEKNRKMQERAINQMSNPDLPQIAREVAKSDAIYWSMENIREYKGETIGKFAVNSSDNSVNEKLRS